MFPDAATASGGRDKVKLKLWREANRERILAQRRERRKRNPEKYRIKDREERVRYASSIKQRQAAWRENNRDHARAYATDYHARNRKACLQRMKQWRERNPETSRAYAARLRRDKYDEVLIANLLRHKRVREATPWWANRDEIAALYRECRLLNRTHGSRPGHASFHVDHVVPLKGRNVCGLHVPWNLRIVEAVVNLKKNRNY